MTQSSEDLNLSFVVDEDDSQGLVKGLHSRLFQNHGELDQSSHEEGSTVDSSFLGETWEQLNKRMRDRTEPSAQPIPRVPSSFGLDAATKDKLERHADAPIEMQNEAWWNNEDAQGQLLALITQDNDSRSSYYVYDMQTIELRCAQLTQELIQTNCLIGGILYAMKANPHPELLEAIVRGGTSERRFGLECVSIEEVRRAAAVMNGIVSQQQGVKTAHSRIQFTPNFCPVEEYEEAFRLGARVIVDNIEILRLRPDIFHGQNVGLRVDPNAHAHQSDTKFGHHAHVRTSGGKQKFGMPIAEALAAVQEAQEELGVNVTGIHVHVGSGVMVPSVWRDTLEKICDLVLENASDLYSVSVIFCF